MPILRPDSVAGLGIHARAFSSVVTSGEDIVTWTDQEPDDGTTTVMGPGGEGQPILAEDGTNLLDETGVNLLTET